MSKLSVSPFREKINAGHSARQNDSSPDGQRLAIWYYSQALTFATIPREKAEAHSAMAVSYRVIGELDMAEDSFMEALLHAEDPLVVALIHRDLGALWHERAVEHLEQNQSVEAEEAFDEAEWFIKKSSSAFSNAGETAEQFTSLGFLGMMLYDQGFRAEGYSLLKEADTVLSGLAIPHPVYEANILIRRIRVSPPHERLRLLPRALHLTRPTSKGGESSGSRKRVFVALLGNRVYRRVVKQQQGK
jgi:tetratricopeptide (TPR) repeat protein